jgi:phosphatidylglycerophosphatase C
MNSPSDRLSASSEENLVQVAAFDVDHTLTHKDCVVPFLRDVAGWGLYAGLIRNVLPLGRALLARDRDRVKAVVTRAALAGRSIEHVDAKARGFATRAFPAWLREDTVKRLRWHHAQGHKVVLVSASYSLYLKYLGKMLSCDAVMGTECETTANAQFTGSLVGPNCRGPEKERRLREWLDGEGFGSYVLYAYGDSSGDDQMLAMANHPFRITKASVTEIPELSPR